MICLINEQVIGLYVANIIFSVGALLLIIFLMFKKNYYEF